MEDLPSAKRLGEPHGIFDQRIKINLNTLNIIQSHIHSLIKHGFIKIGTRRRGDDGRCSSRIERSLRCNASLFIGHLSFIIEIETTRDTKRGVVHRWRNRNNFCTTNIGVTQIISADERTIDRWRVEREGDRSAYVNCWISSDVKPISSYKTW